MKSFIKKIITIGTISCLSWLSVKSDAAENHNITIVEVQQCLPNTKCIELNNYIKKEVINYYKKIDININWETEKLYLDKQLNINNNEISYDKDVWKLKSNLITKLGPKIQNKIVILNTNLDNEDEETKEVLGVAFTTVDLILVKNEVIEKVNKNYSAYVIKHEIGHILGLLHIISNNEECNLMEPYIANNYYRCDDLDEDQINLMKESIKSKNASN